MEFSPKSHDQETLIELEDPRLPDRFWVKVLRDDSGCWIWQAGLARGGYGNFKVDRKNRRAHRVAYEGLIGPIPKGLVIDHLCRQPSCVNPEHLEPVTNRENLLRGKSPWAANARKTHCPAGHALAGENLLTSTKGGRFCRTCKNSRNAAYMKRHKAKDPERYREHERQWARQRYAEDPDFRERRAAASKRYRQRLRERQSGHQGGLT